MPLRLSLYLSLFLAFALHTEAQYSIKTGADQTELYLPLLKGKKVAVVANHTSVINTTHLVDSLLALNVAVKKIFFPEHGFRGDKDAGAYAKNYTDNKTGIPCISLYGKENRKPKASDLKDIDIVLFDIQDVGVRFYTYISTLHYVMEACAESKKTLLVFDRPNPNGFYIDGPVLEENCKSFVGMHPVPVVYGLTIGEYALMINGEKWLQNKVSCSLQVIPLKNYTHDSLYSLPVKPSPNLGSMTSIYLYPSLCLFEGTVVSVGRGTDKPFEQYGYPEMPGGNTTFTPVSIKGASTNPPYKNELCNGVDLSESGSKLIFDSKQLQLKWLMETYVNSKNKELFFNTYFKNLAGTELLKQQITDGLTETEIRNSWKKEADSFMKTRKKYLLYPDFN